MNDDDGCAGFLFGALLALLGLWLFLQAYCFIDLSNTAASACPRVGVSHRNFDRAWWPGNMRVTVVCLDGTRVHLKESQT